MFGFAPASREIRLRSFQNNSVSHLILGGAAVYRCDDWPVFRAGCKALSGAVDGECRRRQILRCARVQGKCRVVSKLREIWIR